jgi:hypothetical protein
MPYEQVTILNITTQDAPPIEKLELLAGNLRILLGFVTGALLGLTFVV